MMHRIKIHQINRKTLKKHTLYVRLSLNLLLEIEIKEKKTRYYFTKELRFRGRSKMYLLHI